MDNSSSVLTGMTNLSLQDAVLEDRTKVQSSTHTQTSAMAATPMHLGQQPLQLSGEPNVAPIRPPPPPDMWNQSQPQLGREPFVAVVDIGNATPLDVTIVQYANRVLMVEAFPHGQDCLRGESGKHPVVHRWSLPGNVDEDSIRSFLGEGKLLIAAFPLPPNFDWPFQTAPALLGPPLRAAWPCPMVKC